MTNVTDNIVAGVPEQSRLTKAEWRLFQECERTIQSGLHAFLRDGKSLALIRRRKLYRQRHRTFESYCKERWHFTAHHARNLIRAWETARAFSPAIPLPPNESLFRPLMTLPLPRREDGWMRALSLAGGVERVTAKDVEAVVKTMGIRRKKVAYDKDAPMIASN